MPRVLRTASFCAALCLISAAAPADDDPFSVQEISSKGRTVFAEITDLDGDGRADVLHGVIFGMPPNEIRLLRVHLQRADGAIPQEADLAVKILKPTAAYDVAEVDGRPGDEVVLLQRRGAELLSVRRDEAGAPFVERRDVLIPNDLTIAASEDERGLDRLDLVSHDFGAEARLMLPGMSETFFLSPEGVLRARIESGGRANYFIQPPGPMLAESDVQIFLDAARISIGNINGDAYPDILASGRHDLRFFFGREDGSYPREADELVSLGRISVQDHIRGSGSARTVARDIDGDGLADLLVSLTIGGVMNASSNTYIHFNRGTGWDLEHPDVAFETENALSADQLIDIDGDGRLEIVRIGIPISILELIEVFLSSALDASLKAYRVEGNGGNEKVQKPSPWFETKLDVDIDFETSRTAGFIPTIDFDVNGDGFHDYLSAADGTKVEIYLGSGKRGFRRRAAEQEIPSEGQLRSGDLDGNGLADFVLFNTRRDHEPIRLLTNRGVLPGTPPSISKSP
jgi:hypothetical protein